MVWNNHLICNFIVNGVYVTTRGCSTKQWEDLQGIIDHRGQNMRCIRNRLLESCYCTGDNCNTAIRIITSSFPLLFSSLSMLLLVNAWMWSKSWKTKVIPSDIKLNLFHHTVTIPRQSFLYDILIVLHKCMNSYQINTNRKNNLKFIFETVSYIIQRISKKIRT